MHLRARQAFIMPGARSKEVCRLRIPAPQIQAEGRMLRRTEIKAICTPIIAYNYDPVAAWGVSNGERGMEKEGRMHCGRLV